ncbi:MAG TPA: 4-oxalomesaconate tautomerase [Devosiaceae bacterium]|jgi:hypothetical protein
MQIKIPCVLMRGGTSRGPYFLASDLPLDEATRDRVLLAAMGSPHTLQVDGLGGGHPLTSKVAIVSLSERPDADIDFLFAQVSVDRPVVDTSPNCGNMIAGVAPFAIEAGLIPAEIGETRVRIHNRNTGALVDAFIQTPGGQVEYEGTTVIDGVGGTAAPVKLNFMNAAGSKTGALFPTGRLREEIDGVEVSLVDYAMPMLLLKAESVGLAGDESAEDIDQMPDLLARLERMRLEAGRRMGLGDVTGRVIPKIGVLSAPKFGSITSRYFVPDRCHKAHAVTGALCVATAASITGTVAADVTRVTPGGPFVLEHPSGRIDIDLDIQLADEANAIAVQRAAVLRTTRRIFEGSLLVPSAVWPQRAGA